MGIATLICLVALMGFPPVFFLLCRGRANIIEVVALLNATGFSILSIAAVVGYWFGLDLNWELFLAVVLSVLTALVVRWVTLEKSVENRSGVLSLSNLIEPITGLQILALAMIVITAAIAAIVGTVDILSADTVHHLASQKRFLANPYFTSDNFILSRSFPYDVVYEAYAGNTFSPIFAEIGRVSGADIGDTFIHFNGFSYAMIGCAVFMLSRRAFRSISNSAGEFEGVCALALLGTYFFTCRLGNYTGTPDLSWVSYPSIFTMSLAFVGLALFGDVHGKADAGSAGLASIIFAGALGFHLQWLLVIAVCMLLFAVMRIPRAIREREIISVVSYGLLVVLAMVIGVSTRLVPLSNVSAGGQSTWDQWPNPSYDAHSMFGRTISFDAFCTKDIVGLLACCALLTVLVLKARKSNTPIGKVLQTPMAWIGAIPIVFYVIFFCSPLTALVLHFVPQPVVLRVFWFTDVLFIICVGWASALAFEKAGSLLLGPARWLSQGTIVLVLAGAFIATYWSQGRSLYATNKAWVNAGYLSYESVKRDSDLPRLLSSLKLSDTLLILQQGPAASKNVEFDLAPVKMAEPTYALGPTEKKIADRFNIDKNTSAESLEDLLKKYEVTYVTSWVWPGQTVDLMAGRPGLSLVGDSHIRRPGLPDVQVKLYRVHLARH